MFEKSNDEIVTNFWQAFTKGDAKEVTKFLDDKVVWQAMGTVGGDPVSIKRNKEEIGELAVKMKTTLKQGLTLTPLAWTCQGNRVAVEMEGSGVVLATGKSYHNFYHFLIVLEDKKIVTIKEYMDTLHAKRVFIDK